MANLSKTDPTTAAIHAAGITNADDVAAIRSLVGQGEALEDAIAAFAPTTGAALATNQPADPLVPSQAGRRKAKKATQVELQAQSLVGGPDTTALGDAAFQRGVETAHQLGALTRQQMAEGFSAQARQEAEATQQFLGAMVENFGGMLGG